MTKNEEINMKDNCDDWINNVRIGIYEERKRIGDEEYDRRMEIHMKELAEQYGFKRVKDVGGEYHNAR